MKIDEDEGIWDELFSMGPVCIFKWDAIHGEWPVLAVTGNVEILTGWTAEEFLSGVKGFDDLIHEDDADRVWAEEEVWENAGYAANTGMNYRITCKSG